MTNHDPQQLLGHTTALVHALIAANAVSTSGIPALIESTYQALANTLPSPTIAAATPEPAVDIRKSIKHDYIVCLEDGKKLKMLKRYLRTNYNMTPDEYRAKWGLPRDYPMVAPAYAEKRRSLAVSIGLGRSRPAPTPATRRRSAA